MKTRPWKFLPVVFAAWGLSIGSAKAFDPFFGFFGGLSEFEVLAYLFAGDPFSSRDNFDATASVTQTGTVFDAQVQVKGKKGPEKVDVVINLNADGTGSCLVGGTVIAGKGAKVRGPRPGSKFKIKSKAAGTWALAGGVQTVMAFSGKTNGVPTTINAIMDLNAAGQLTLDVKLKFKKNKLLKKASLKFIGTRK